MCFKVASPLGRNIEGKHQLINQTIHIFSVEYKEVEKIRAANEKEQLRIEAENREIEEREKREKEEKKEEENQEGDKVDTKTVEEDKITTEE